MTPPSDEFSVEITDNHFVVSKKLTDNAKSADTDDENLSLFESSLDFQELGHSCADAGRLDGCDSDDLGAACYQGGNVVQVM